MRNKWQKALILLCVFGKVIDQQGRNFFPSRVAKAGQHVEKPTSDDFPGKKSRGGQIQIQKNDMYYIIYIYIHCLYYGKPNNGPSQFYRERMGFQPSSSGGASAVVQFRCGLEDEHFAMACWECSSFISFIAILAQRMQRIIELIPAPYYRHLGKPQCVNPLWSKGCMAPNWHTREY